MKPSAPHTASPATTPPLSQEEHRDSDPASDIALMTAIQGKDPAALDTLYQRYRLLLKSVILRVVRSHASADDVMQECMLEIWHHATNYSSQKGTPLGWIVTL